MFLVLKCWRTILMCRNGWCVWNVHLCFLVFVMEKGSSDLYKFGPSGRSHPCHSSRPCHHAIQKISSPSPLTTFPRVPWWPRSANHPPQHRQPAPCPRDCHTPAVLVTCHSLLRSTHGTWTLQLPHTARAQYTGSGDRHHITQVD